MNEVVGIDIIGYGPVGIELSIKLAKLRDNLRINSISDSSGGVKPANNSQVFKIAEWKAEGKFNKLAQFPDAMRIRDPLEEIEESNSSIVVDATNSDYSRHEEAKTRAKLALNSGKHYVTANKVGLAFHFAEIFELARKNNLRVGQGATNISARHAIIVAQRIQEKELERILSLLNSATTVILSSLEGDSSLSEEGAIEIARKQGILESDPAIDLDGWDAAAKTAILSSSVFQKHPISILDVKRKGIRDEEAEILIENVRNNRSPKFKVREVSEITKDSACVEPRLIEAGSSLDVQGHTGIVVLYSKLFGEIAIKSTFHSSGADLTSSVLLSDIMEIINGD